MSILFYTDSDELTRKMKYICRKKSKDETDESYRKRHSELVNWLRLMMETILLYGGQYGKGSEKVYHGLDTKFYFDQFKAKFFIPTSTTMALTVAQKFAKN